MSDSMLNVFANDEEWVIAASAEDADKVCEELGMGPKYSDDTSQWSLCDATKPFALHGDDGEVTKTFGEWAAEKGRGFFASVDD